MKKQIKPRFCLFIFLVLSIAVILPVNQSHAWYSLMGAHGGMGSAYMDTTVNGGHVGGLSIASEEVITQAGPRTYVTYAYIKFITGFDFNYNPLPWAGGGENLTEAQVMLKGKVFTGTAPLNVEIYHITNNNFDPDTVNWGNQPLQDDSTFFPGFGTQTVATLLTKQSIPSTNLTGITWDLLESGSPYLDIWNTQDKLDHTISLMFKLFAGESGKVVLQQDGCSLYLEGDNNSPNPVPVPAAAWLLGTGLVGLFGVRKKIIK
jgi:hypothetical protein